MNTTLHESTMILSYQLLNMTSCQLPVCYTWDVFKIQYQMVPSNTSLLLSHLLTQQLS